MIVKFEVFDKKHLEVFSINMHKHIKFTYIHTEIPEYLKSLGSTRIGMRPNLWASTSSWTIDVLFAKRTFSIAIVGTYIKIQIKPKSTIATM